MQCSRLPQQADLFLDLKKSLSPIRTHPDHTAAHSAVPPLLLDGSGAFNVVGDEVNLLQRQS